MGEYTGHLARIWARNTVVIAVGVLVALAAGVDGRWLRLVLVVAGLLELWSTVTCIRSWMFTATYRWFWWWRR